MSEAHDTSAIYDLAAEWEREKTGWLDPVSLDAAPLPPWPRDVFPGPGQEFVDAASCSTETPPELAALMVLAVFATAAQGKYRVQIRPDYSEPLSLWSVVAMPPGSRKSAVLGLATAPLKDWERRQRDNLEAARQKAQAELDMHIEHVKHLRLEAAKAKGVDREKLKQQVLDADANAPVVPEIPQVWTNDVTPENLVTIMAANDERMAILSDEGGVFETMTGRYSRGVPNLDIYLQGHTGTSVRVNRGSRPPVFLGTPALSFGLTPQPDVLRGLTKNPELRGRGLLARFLYAVPPSNLGYRTGRGTPVPEGVKEAFARTVAAILDLPWAESGAGQRVAHVLRLDDEAQDAFGGCAQGVERELREGGLYVDVPDWAGKLPGTLVRVAGLLHVARHAHAHPEQVPIGARDMGAALQLVDVLSAHAHVAFDLMGADPALDGARIVLRWLQREGRDTFRFRDCHAAHKSRFKRATDLEPCIEVLAERHFIAERGRTSGRGRPSRLFDVNPAVHSTESRHPVR